MSPNGVTQGRPGAGCDTGATGAHRRRVRPDDPDRAPASAGHHRSGFDRRCRPPPRIPKSRPGGRPRSSIATGSGEFCRRSPRGGAVHASIDDLLDDQDVALVDIAVPATLQPEIAIRALDAGKDVICQKPLALDLGAGQRIVDRAAQLGRKVAVQQQLRFEEGIAATREMIRRAWIGEPTAVSFTVDVQTDFSAWSWLVEGPKLELYYHSIHYFDAIRALIGEPAHVFGRSPGGPVSSRAARPARSARSSIRVTCAPSSMRTTRT